MKEQQYRPLEAGETIQEGDEGKGTILGWFKTTAVGDKVDKAGTYRRPITLPAEQACEGESAAILGARLHEAEKQLEELTGMWQARTAELRQQLTTALAERDEAIRHAPEGYMLQAGSLPAAVKLMHEGLWAFQKDREKLTTERDEARKESDEMCTHWSGKYYGLQKERDEALAQVEALKKELREISNMCSAPHWNTDRRYRIRDKANQASK